MGKTKDWFMEVVQEGHDSDYDFDYASDYDYDYSTSQTDGIR